MLIYDCIALIDGEKRLGTVTKVTASGLELNLPKALAASGRRDIARGTVGDFVFIDCDIVVVLGRILEVQIPERNRPVLERQSKQETIVDPVGRVQLLATIHKATLKADRGVLVSPRVGDSVFPANGHSLTRSIQAALFGSVDTRAGKEPTSVSLGSISGFEEANIALPPEVLFGRHCGIFGATGGGKSWTLAKLVNEVGRLGGKAILFDATGEYSGKVFNATEFEFAEAQDGHKLVRFPSEKLSELSLFALLRPTGQSQGPTMREAIRSLRLARTLLLASKSKESDIPERRCVGSSCKYSGDFGTIEVEENGALKKSGQRIECFNHASLKYRKELASEHCNFDIQVLPEQMNYECVWPTDRSEPNKFGKTDDNRLSYCNTLIVRMQVMLESPELECIFGNKGDDFCTKLEEFLECEEKHICVISFKNVSFNYNARELLLNTLGEYLLGLARKGKFNNTPLICFLDEAHQFMGRSVGDEFNNVSLDAFGLIAKEGRKYGLTTVIATQRPHDVPQDVLSQLCTLFVHRLTNKKDREAIESACSDLDRSAAAFIPSLSQGEAILLGSDLPAPLPITMEPPKKSAQPSSYGPDYQKSLEGLKTLKFFWLEFGKIFDYFFKAHWVRLFFWGDMDCSALSRVVQFLCYEGCSRTLLGSAWTGSGSCHPKKPLLARSVFARRCGSPFRAFVCGPVDKRLTITLGQAYVVFPACEPFPLLRSGCVNQLPSWVAFHL